MLFRVVANLLPLPIPVLDEAEWSEQADDCRRVLIGLRAPPRSLTGILHISLGTLGRAIKGGIAYRNCRRCYQIVANSSPGAVLVD